MGRSQSISRNMFCVLSLQTITMMICMSELDSITTAHTNAHYMQITKTFFIHYCSLTTPPACKTVFIIDIAQH